MYHEGKPSKNSGKYLAGVQFAACVLMALGACIVLPEIVIGFIRDEIYYITLMNVLYIVLMPIVGILWYFCLRKEENERNKHKLMAVHTLILIALVGRFLFCVDYIIFDGDYQLLDEIVSMMLAFAVEIVLLKNITGRKVNVRFKDFLLKLNCSVMIAVSGVGGIITAITFCMEGSFADAVFEMLLVGVSITFFTITWKETEGKMSGVMIVLLMVALGGILSFAQESVLLQGFPLENFPIIVILYLMTLYIAIILHELGHMIFGLLTGYHFQSFRISSLMIKKEQGRLRFCRYSLAGTGGQCLMDPPDFVDGKIPYVLYNLGGVLMNAFSVLIFGGIYLCFEFGFWGSAFLELLILLSVIETVINGIPLKLRMVNNDADNVLELGRDPESLRAWWLQLKINARMAEGKCLKEVPENWVRLPSDLEMKNSIIAVEGVIYCNLLMEERRFEEAKETIQHLLGIESGIVGIHRGLLTCDEIYCMIACQVGKEEIRKRIDKQLEKFIKSMKKYPAVMRTQFAYELCVMHDEEKAERVRKAFEKVAEKYPYEVEIEYERGLMKLVERLE